MLGLDGGSCTSMNESPRPPVKRTYSRLPAKVEESKEGSEELKDREEHVPRVMEWDSQKKKKTKITDFFQKKIVDREESEVPKCKTDRPTEVKIPTTAKTQSQTFLDLGQKNLFSTQCQDCGMHYNKSFVTDVQLHRRFHGQSLKGFTMDGGLWKLMREVAPPMDAVKRWQKYRFFVTDSIGEERVFKRLREFVDFVNVQLGAAEQDRNELVNLQAVMAVDAASNRIVAFASLQVDETSGISAYLSSEDCDDSNIQLEMTSKRTVKVGVSRIWTDQRHRRQGLAALLLDIKLTDKKWNRNEIAFSQPTPSGLAFARAYQKDYFNGKRCLIYC